MDEWPGRVRIKQTSHQRICRLQCRIDAKLVNGAESRAKIETISDEQEWAKLSSAICDILAGFFTYLDVYGLAGGRRGYGIVRGTLYSHWVTAHHRGIMA